MHLVWIENDLIPFLFLISNHQSWTQNVSVYRGILVTVVTKCQDNFIYLSPCMIGDITPQNRSDAAKRERERYFPLEHVMGRNMCVFHFSFKINKMSRRQIHWNNLSDSENSKRDADLLYLRVMSEFVYSQFLQSFLIYLRH